MRLPGTTWSVRQTRVLVLFSIVAETSSFPPCGDSDDTCHLEATDRSAFMQVDLGQLKRLVKKDEQVPAPVEPPSPSPSPSSEATYQTFADSCVSNDENILEKQGLTLQECEDLCTEIDVCQSFEFGVNAQDVGGRGKCYPKKSKVMTVCSNQDLHVKVVEGETEEDDDTTTTTALAIIVGTTVAVTTTSTTENSSPSPSPSPEAQVKYRLVPHACLGDDENIVQKFGLTQPECEDLCNQIDACLAYDFSPSTEDPGRGNCVPKQSKKFNMDCFGKEIWEKILPGETTSTTTTTIGKALSSTTTTEPEEEPEGNSGTTTTTTTIAVDTTSGVITTTTAAGNCGKVFYRLIPDACVDDADTILTRIGITQVECESECNQIDVCLAYEYRKSEEEEEELCSGDCALMKSNELNPTCIGKEIWLKPLSTTTTITEPEEDLETTTTGTTTTTEPEENSGTATTSTTTTSASASAPQRKVAGNTSTTTAPEDSGGTTTTSTTAPEDSGGTTTTSTTIEPGENSATTTTTIGTTTNGKVVATTSTTTTSKEPSDESTVTTTSTATAAPTETTTTGTTAAPSNPTAQATTVLPIGTPIGVIYHFIDTNCVKEKKIPALKIDTQIEVCKAMCDADSQCIAFEYSTGVVHGDCVKSLSNQIPDCGGHFVHVKRKGHCHTTAVPTQAPTAPPGAPTTTAPRQDTTTTTEGVRFYSMETTTITRTYAVRRRMPVFQGGPI